MNIPKLLPRLVGLLALLGSIIPAASQATNYTPGFEWNRSQDWIPGTIPNSTAGNPSVDKNGNPVWFYGYSSGGELGSENPWYAQKLSPLIWDDDWRGSTSGGVWARGYNGPEGDNIDTNPPIAKWAMTHDLSKVTLSAAYVPVVEWQNPVGDGAIINVGGSLLVSWEGIYNENSPAGAVDIAVARMDASAGSAELLYSTTLTNPAEGGPLLWPDIPPPEIRNTWGVGGLRMDEGDTLRFSLRMRGDEIDPPLWALLDDQSTTITLVSKVPEPEQYILLALGLGVLAARLRRTVKG